MSEDCLFCKIIAGEIPSTEVFSSETVYAFEDINPAAPTHLLIVPRIHIPMISDLQSEDAPVMGELLHAAKQIGDQQDLSDYRLVVNNGSGAGQTVFHIHLHLIGGRPMEWPPG